MSTRANILLTDNDGNKLWFYQHSDGYPEGVMPTLDKFTDALKDHSIRDNINQAAGWLILFGAKIMAEFMKKSSYVKYGVNYIRSEPEPTDGMYGWKAGFIEPTTAMHGDIEFLYVVNVDTKKVKVVTEYVTMQSYE